jgi:hypothetical protein
MLGTTPVEARIRPRAVKLVVGPRYRLPGADDEQS